MWELVRGGAPGGLRWRRGSDDRCGGWSWDNFNGDCKPGDGGQSPFDMTTDGLSFSALRPGWATEVVVSDPNSIQNTSKRPKSFVRGTCG